MKKFLLKSANAALFLIALGCTIYTLFTITIAFLPENLSHQVVDFLGMNYEKIAATTVSTALTTLAIWIAKIMQVRTSLAVSRVEDNAAKVVQKAQDKLQTSEQRDSVIVERMNETIKQQKAIIKQQAELLNFERSKAQMRIKSKVISADAKECFKRDLEALDKLDGELKYIDMISTIKEETVEKVVEKPTESNAGRY